MSEQRRVVAVLDCGEGNSEVDNQEAELLLHAIGIDEVRRDRIVGCPHCGGFLMVEGGVCESCEFKKVHKSGCRYLLAAICAIPIECTAHGRDVCPECDACNCSELP